MQRIYKYILILSFLCTLSLITLILFDEVLMPYYVRLGDTTVLPGIEGLNVIEAQRILYNKGFEMVIKEKKYHASLRDGTVMTQNPIQGTKVKKGRKVYLVISMGEKPVVVPNFRGYNQQQAKIRCVDIGLNLIETKFEHNNNYPGNTVFEQSLEANTEVKRNTDIILTVSLGKNPNEKLIIPDFTGMSYEKAESEIERLGLFIRSVVRKSNAEYLPNTVIRQLGLLPEMEAFPGDSLDLVITK